jgi:hypothetical protein
MNPVRLVLLLSGVIAISCIQKVNPGKSGSKSSAAGLDRCVAIRGNGTHVIAHLTGLARITNSWGQIDAMAGGSSATLTTFLYESILLNPAVEKLAGDDRVAAISLLLKSITGYAMAATESPEWKSVVGTARLASELVRRPEMMPGALADKRNGEMILKAIQNPDIQELINPEVTKNLATALASADPKIIDQHIKDTRASVGALTSLDASNPDVFVRNGILNFPHLVEMIGRVADFYAGIDSDQAIFSDFIRRCATSTRDRVWADVSRHEAGSQTCGEIFSDIASRWRKSRPSKPSTRLLERPGLRLPNIMITSVVKGKDSIKKIMAYEKAWRENSPRQLNMSFDEVDFGYWISQGFQTNSVSAMKQLFPGMKSRKATDLGAASTWREILEKSPREPSLGSYTIFSQREPAAGGISLGGWADLHPVEVLKAAGCKNVIYLTRRTDETAFVTHGKPFEGRERSGIAELLGLGQSDYEGLYDLDNPASAFSQALGATDSTWCTSWNDYSAMQQMEIASDAWSAPLLSSSDRIQGWSGTIEQKTKIRGCSHGVGR